MAGIGYAAKSCLLLPHTVVQAGVGAMHWCVCGYSK